MTVVVDFVYVAVATPTYVGVVAPSFWLWTATVQRQRTTLRPRTPALAGSTVFMLTPHVLLLTFAYCVFPWLTSLSGFSFSTLFSFLVLVF